MAVYNFRQNTKFYIVYAGSMYLLDVYNDATFSQTFTEEDINKRTLHNQNLLFDDAVIVKAAPANFSFTMPLLDEDDLKVVFNLLTGTDAFGNISSFDIYAQTDKDVYKIEKCVMEEGHFSIPKNGYITLAVSGSASRIYRVGTTGTYNIATSSGSVLVARSLTRTPGYAKTLKVTLGGTVLDYISQVSLSIQNKIAWRPVETLQASLAVTNASNTMYPLNFDTDNRVLSGAIQQYVTDASYTNLQTWATGVSLAIQVGAGSVNNMIDLNIPAPPGVVYTNRVEVNDIFTQTFDFRMLATSTALSSIIVYN